jgi:hypothetical protein
MALDFIFWYSKVTNKIAKYCKNIYLTNPMLKHNVDWVNYLFQYVMAFFGNYRIEPFSQNWICTGYLIKNKSIFFSGEAYSYLQFYDILEPDVVQDVNLINSTITTAYDAGKNNNTVEQMIIAKNVNKYIYLNHKYNQTPIIQESTLNTTLCKPRFLSVEYKHAGMDSSILLELDKHMYVVDSVILSPIFIRRLLEHSPTPFVFDMDYMLNIMDNNVTMFTLSSNQSIRISKTGYDIITNPVVGDATDK